jgi:hypothetical protein
MRLETLASLGVALLVASPLIAQNEFHGCGIAGTAKTAGINERRSLLSHVPT